MKLTVFPSDKGDCLLLTSHDGHHVLVDGGMSASYRTYVAPRLEALGSDSQKLDVVYVSHTDQDHIGGILALADDAFLWKVFAAHLDTTPDDGQSDAPDGFRRPRNRPRPPAVDKFWYNAFSAALPGDQIEFGTTLVRIATALAAASESGVLREAALATRELVASVGEGIQLNNRLDERQLGYPVNPEFGGDLMQIESVGAGVPAPLPIGSMRFHLIGPFREDLENFAQYWEEWIESHKEEARRIEDERKTDDRALPSNEFERLQRSLIALAARLGDRGEVTPPNLASLMFLVEEDGRSILLTGDGHGQDILRGLERQEKLDADGGIHVDVLKVQHHGSEHNLDEEFCRRVTANHYVFCGNGDSGNPDLRVVEALVDSRIGPAHSRSKNSQTKNRFRFWFNNSSTFDDEINAENKGHMALIEADVASYINQSGDQMSATFITNDRWRSKKRLELSVGG
jgi:beta-lactamase superfamily II metal-dependent hydrolase